MKPRHCKHQANTWSTPALFFKKWIHAFDILHHPLPFTSAMFYLLPCPTLLQINLQKSRKEEWSLALFNKSNDHTNLTHRIPPHPTPPHQLKKKPLREATLVSKSLMSQVEQHSQCSTIHWACREWTWCSQMMEIGYFCKKNSLAPASTCVYFCT